MGASVVSNRVDALLSTGGKLFVASRATLAFDSQYGSFVHCWDGEQWNLLMSVVSSSPQQESVLGHYGTSLATCHNGRLLVWSEGSIDTVAAVLSGDILAISEHNGDLYVGGDMFVLSGLPPSYCARWDGQVWWGVDIGVRSRVRSFLTYQAGLFVGADSTITRLEGEEPSNVAWTDGPVFAMHEFDGLLIAAGRFSNVAGTPARCIAGWNGTNWSAIGEGLDDDRFSPTGAALCSYRGALIVGGEFNRVGANSASALASWNGLELSPVAWELDGFVSTCETFGDVLVIGGGLRYDDSQSYGYACLR